MKINNKRELRNAYELLNIASAHTQMKDYTDLLKKAIREYRDRTASEEQVVRDSGDSLLTVFPLPRNLETAEEAAEYFEANHYREFYPSAYDCTGQIFTTWYKIFKRGGQFWAYHATAMDV